MTDSLAFLDQVAGLPEQLAAAHEAAGEAIQGRDLPAPESLKNIVMLGMGGSGISGDVFNVVNNGDAVVFLDVTLFSVLTPLLPSYQSDHDLSDGAAGILWGTGAAIVKFVTDFASNA